MSRAPRIDTMRNRLAATRELLSMAEAEMVDLHVLAYDRQAAKAEITVSGGQADWALDNHGDIRARNAYVAIADAVTEACDVLAPAAHDVIRLLREGDSPEHGKGRVRIDIEEHAALIEHQAVRIANGDYTPHRTHAQPNADKTTKVVDRLRAERDQALTEVDRLNAKLAAIGIERQPRKRGWRSA